MFHRARRVYLDAINRPEGTTWFTLVFKDPSTFFVEQVTDSILAFFTNRIRMIPPEEFSKYSINGRSLSAIVESKLREIDKAARV